MKTFACDADLKIAEQLMDASWKEYLSYAEYVHQCALAGVGACSELAYERRCNQLDSGLI